MAASSYSDTKVEANTSTAPTLSPRARIARQILVYHFILIGISCVYYLLRGFEL